MTERARRRAGRCLGAVPALGVLAAEVERAGDAAERHLTWAVAGLVGLAVLILVATVLFWRATRPEAATTAAPAMRWVPPSDAPAPFTTRDDAAARPGRRDAPAGAGADADGTPRRRPSPDRPRGDGPAPRRPPERRPDQPRPPQQRPAGQRPGGQRAPGRGAPGQRPPGQRRPPGDGAPVQGQPGQRRPAPRAPGDPARRPGPGPAGGGRGPAPADPDLSQRPPR